VAPAPSMEVFIGGLEISALRGREDTKRCDDVQRRIPATFIDDGLPNRYQRALLTAQSDAFGKSRGSKIGLRPWWPAGRSSEGAL
jgi:hypothetical protein